MTPMNVRQQILEWTEFNAGYDPGNGQSISTTGQDDVWELVQNTASVAETRTFAGPTKSGLKVKIVLLSAAAGGTLVLSVNNSAGNVSLTVTFTTVGTFVKLESVPSGITNGVKTFAWVATFSNV